MSWSVDAWRNSTSWYCDRMHAISTLETPYDAYTGRASIYQSVEAEYPFPIDMIVESVNFNYDEHTQTSPHIGNSFSFIAFGKNVMRLQVNGVIADSGANFGKDTFMDVYRNYLRLEAVARRGVAPLFVFPNAAMYCAASSLELTETNTSDDLVYFSMTLEVIKAVFKNDERNFMLSYIHGTEVAENTVISAVQETDAQTVKTTDDTPVVSSSISGSSAGVVPTSEKNKSSS